MLSRFIAALVAMAIVNLASSLAFAASISLSVQAGPPDTKTIVKGTGLGANAIHEVYFGLQQLTFGVTDGAGKLTLELNIPETALPGNQVISIIPHSGNGASAQKFFEVRTNWTQWHHDAASTGRVAFDNVLKTTTVKNLGLSWRLPGGSVQSAPLLVDKAVYYITSDGHLRAVNRNTRAPVFNIVAGALPLTAPAYGGGKVIVAAAGKIKAFSSKTGALAWKANLPPGVGTPVVSDGIVYVVAEGNTNAGVFAFKVDCGTGSAARFFYCAKASKKDRNEGLEAFDAVMANFAAGTGLSKNGDGSPRNMNADAKNPHPTVKPTELMRYLCRLVTPPGGLIVDPFAGSGSTGKAAILEGFQFVGFELDPQYSAIANARLEAARNAAS